MKKLARNKSSAFIRGVFAVVTLVVLWITMAPFCAEAALQGSAGNTIIRNTVTVNYKDNNGNAQAAVLSTIDLTVTTVAAAPTVLSITPSPGSTDGTGATQVYTVRVRTNSNGPGSITIGGADGSFINIAAGAAPTVSVSPIFLGSTVFDPSNFPGMGAQNIAINATITIAIPNDGGVPTDSTTTGGAIGSGGVNALVVNDIVYISDGTNYYGPLQVTAVADNAIGAGNTAAPDSVTLKNISAGALAFTPAYGWEILEAKDVTVTVTQGAVTNPALAANWVTTVTATMGGLSGTNTVTTNAHASQLTIQKYVRNVTTPVVGGGLTLVNPPINNTVTYYQTGVSGKPGDTLEYAVKITDTGTGNAGSVIATDPIPTYSTLISSSGVYGANNTGGATGTFAQVYSSRTGTTGSLKIDNSGGLLNVGYGKAVPGQAAGSIMTFYLGIGSTTAAGGTVNSAETDYVIYQTKID